jgi:hypothetical protein
VYAFIQARKKVCPTCGAFCMQSWQRFFKPAIWAENRRGLGPRLECKVFNIMYKQAQKFLPSILVSAIVALVRTGINILVNYHIAGLSQLLNADYFL